MSQFFFDFGPIFWLITTGLALIALVWLAWLSFSNRDEDETATAPGELERTSGQVSKLTWETMELKTLISSSVHAVGLAYHDTNSNTGESFSVALANSRGEGIIFTGMQESGQTRVCTKLLSNWTSDRGLSTEESKAVEKARRQALKLPEKPKEAGGAD